MKAVELINKEIDFTEERLKNTPFVITKLECKILMESYARLKAVEFGKHIRLKEANEEWETGKSWEDYYDEFNS